ncbi:DUF3311 domain-containing protein [Pirellulales bacterium]|nr:DUF3311 domain-containing protein [Pirellulales bacterium]
MRKPPPAEAGSAWAARPFRMLPNSAKILCMTRIVWALILLLLVLHQDNWFWSDGRLVFGFIPTGLFYHACLSLAAGAVWLFAVKYAWPAGVDDDAPEDAAR